MHLTMRFSQNDPIEQYLELLIMEIYFISYKDNLSNNILQFEAKHHYLTLLEQLQLAKTDELQ